MDKNKQNFFWEKRIKKKSRFNLLLLEYGEYFLEDLSAYCVQVPGDSLRKKSFKIHESLKTQGRIKLCSRSLLFEPSDPRKAIVRFPFKYFLGEPELYQLSQDEISQSSVRFTGAFTFRCSTVFEMKSNDKIAPYQQIDCASRSEGAQTLFGLVHADPNVWLNKLLQLKQIFYSAMKNGWSVAQEQLLPFIASPTSTFDSSQLVDFHETHLFASAVPVQRIRPLELIPGALMITDARIYFQPAQLTGLGEGTQLQVLELRNVAYIYTRRHLLSQTGLELIMSDGDKSALFSFQNEETRNQMHKLLTEQSKRCGGLVSQSLEQMLRLWQARKISNFDYLSYLNAEAGRSLSDLAQYPVFPHILVDFKSSELDLDDVRIYRDLSKPVGALNPQRLEHFRQRYRNMVATASPATHSPPPFLYGTHYSTPGYVLYYLARVAPEHMLCLQGGRFDSPDRMFSSVSGMWDSCLTNPADLKELIPEFFCGEGEFLTNIQNLDFGRLQQGVGQKLGDVDLPPWCNGSPKEFIRLHRGALESEHVSQHLHLWIDIIFGHKQQGQEALAADNLFFHLTYERAVDELVREQKDASQICVLEAQVQEFGQTPSQLFSGPHPSRSDVTAPVSVLSRKSQSSVNIARNSSEKASPQSLQLEPKAAPNQPRPCVNPQSHPIASSTFAAKAPLGFGLLQQTVALLDRSFFGGARPQSAISPPAGTQYTGISVAGAVHSAAPPAVPVANLSGKRVWSCFLRIPSQSLVSSLATTDSSHRPRGPPLICAGLSDGTLKIFDIGPGPDGSLSLVASTRRSARLSSSGLVVCVSGDGALVVAGSSDGKLHSYSVLKGTVLCQRDAHESAISVLGMDASGSWVVTGAKDGSVRMWTVVPGGGLSQTPAVELLELQNSVTATSMLSVGRSKKLVACGSEDGVTVVWDVQAVRDAKGLWALQGTVLCRVVSESAVSCCGWLPVTSERPYPLLICGYSHGSLVAWEVNSCFTLLTEVRVEGVALRSLSVALVGNLAVIFVGTSVGDVRSWTFQRTEGNRWSFQELWSEHIQSSDIPCLASGSDGVLMTGGADGIFLWETRLRNDS